MIVEYFAILVGVIARRNYSCVKANQRFSRPQLTFCNELSIEEKLTYVPHPTIADTTLLKQEAVITVHGIPLSSYFEDFISKTISGNASKVSSSHANKKCIKWRYCVRTFLG